MYNTVVYVGIPKIACRLFYFALIILSKLNKLCDSLMYKRNLILRRFLDAPPPSCLSCGLSSLPPHAWDTARIVSERPTHLLLAATVRRNSISFVP